MIRPTEPKPAKFTIYIGDQRAQLSYQGVFAIGYHLWRKQKFEEAAKVFERISHVSDRGPRAHILLAHCRAMLGDYASCASALSTALPEEIYGDAATELHSVCISWKCAMYRDVKQGLEKIATEHPELPTISLILADFMRRMGNTPQQFHWLKEAAAHDRPNGAIAQIARRRIQLAVNHSAGK